MNLDDSLNMNILEEKTTYKNDYRKYPPTKTEIFTWPNDREEIRVKQKVRKGEGSLNMETFQPWYKGKHIPFDLLWQPKDIVRTNPFDVFENKERPMPEIIKEERVVVKAKKCLVPAINIDDIESKEDRDLLIKYMYTTEFQRALEESCGGFKPKPAEKYSDIGSYSGCKENIIVPKVPEGKIDQIKDWDDKQIIAIAEPTEHFWNDQPEINEGNVDCPYKEVPQEVKDKIKKLIKEDELRLPYDYPKPGYEGYKPNLAKGVTLEKGDKPVTHPMLTVAQALTKRYAQDLIK